MNGKSKFAYDAIKSKILEGVLPPLSDVSEEQLQEELQISRTPVREALLQLAKEGFVHIYPRKGSIVADITLDLLSEVYAIRGLNEPFIAKNAAQSAPRERILEIRNGVRQCPKGYTDQRRSRFYIDQDRLFHAQLLSCCTNRFVKSIMENVYDHMHRIRLRTVELNANNDRSYNEHMAIIDAILARDEAQIDAAVAAHLAKYRNFSYRFFTDGNLSQEA